MKKIWLIALVATVILVSCAEEEEQIPEVWTELSVNFLVQPQGGSQVDSLECSFNGRITLHGLGFTDPITADIYWMRSETATGEGGYFWSKSYTFSETESYYMNHEAEPGHYLLGYYWVLVQWQNGDGSWGEATSNRAHCYD